MLEFATLGRRISASSNKLKTDHCNHAKQITCVREVCLASKNRARAQRGDELLMPYPDSAKWRALVIERDGGNYKALIKTLGYIKNVQADVIIHSVAAGRY